MYYYPEDVYGANVQLTKLRIEGLKPDGTAYPGADIECMVRFNPYEAGCNPPTVYCDPGANDCTCDPGAQIQWYVNGSIRQDTVWTGYIGDGIGYAATFRVIAPQSGFTTVQAQSANTVDFSFETTATDQDAGIVSISDVYCGNSPYNNASCDGAILIIYFYRNIVEVGSGIAYVDLYIDGALRTANIPTSSTSYNGYDSYTIPCPTDGVDHTILVKGENDIGASVVLPAGGVGDPCATNNCASGCPDTYGANRCALCGIDCDTTCITNPCANTCSAKPCSQCPNQTGCIHPPGGTGILDQILAFIQEQPVVALGAAGVLAYVLMK
jgi:hypothetical protein